jgi:hypothetical protein
VKWWQDVWADPNIDTTVGFPGTDREKSKVQIRTAEGELVTLLPRVKREHLEQGDQEVENIVARLRDMYRRADVTQREVAFEAGTSTNGRARNGSLACTQATDHQQFR